MGPNVIVQVLTRPAPQQDIDALDGGYVTPDSIHHAALTWGIPLLGPVRDDPQAAQRPGFTKEDFHIDWDNPTLTCPNGITSPPWKPTLATDIPGCPFSSPARHAGNARTA
ncbi:hypothetical protein [Streptomyces mirabilis]|uniref:hypothetical protein n=1 Tax=Streptomyces mirabilis TaxID=68239 RepID=UPI0036D7BA0B